MEHKHPPKAKSFPADVDATEVFPAFAQDKPRSWKVPAGLGIFIGVAVLGYLGLAAAVSGSVPRGVTVAGVEIGSMKPQAAIQKLEKDLGPRLSEPFKVSLQQKSARLDPVAAG